MELRDPIARDSIVSDLSTVPETFQLRVLLKVLEDLGGTIVLFGGVVSDAYTMDSTLKDDQFGHTMYARVEQPTSNTLPKFNVTSLPDLEIYAELAFNYTLPETIDPEMPDQTLTVSVSPQQSGNTWLKVSSDSKELYTEAGASTAFKMGTYSFTVKLNDGFLFGDNETDYPLTVTILPKPNQLPYFVAPGLLPQKIEMGQTWRYSLPATADDDGDNVTLTLDTSSTTWMFFNQNTLIVLEGATNDPALLGDYVFPITLEDDSQYG